MAFGFLIPVAKFVLRAVVGEVLGAEKLFGAGKGDEKLDAVAKSVSELIDSRFDLDKVGDIAEDIVTLVNAVVETLNALGLLDDEPGLDVDYAVLVPAVRNIFVSIATLADAIR